MVGCKSLVLKNTDHDDCLLGIADYKSYSLFGIAAEILEAKMVDPEHIIE